MALGPAYAGDGLSYERAMHGWVDALGARTLTMTVRLAMIDGFTRRVADVAADRRGAAYFVDAAVEAARLARQVFRLASPVVARRFAEGSVGAWRLDNEEWVDIPGSCYAYRPESERLFAERTIVAAATPDLYAPAAGTRGAFARGRTPRAAPGA